MQQKEISKSVLKRLPIYLSYLKSLADDVPNISATALIETNRSNEALMQYKYATHLQYRYLGIQPSEDMQEFYI